MPKPAPFHSPVKTAQCELDGHVLFPGTDIYHAPTNTFFAIDSLCRDLLTLNPVLVLRKYGPDVDALYSIAWEQIEETGEWRVR